MTTPTISIVVPTFRRPESLGATLWRVVRLDYEPDAYEVIVVDDGSGDQTAAVVQGFTGLAVPVRTVHQANRGVAAARNLGARLAQGDMIVFLDDDMLVEPSFLRRHVATHSRYPRALVNGEWVFPPEMLEGLRRTPFGRYRIELEATFRQLPASQILDGECVACHVMSGQDLSIQRALFWEIGGFDEGFRAPGAEDQELSYRARDAGCMLVRNRAIRLMHADAHLSLEAFCRREGRRAETVVVLAQRYPSSAAAASYERDNGPIRLSDGPVLTGKKLLKSVASRTPCLFAARLLLAGTERIGVSDALLARGYSTLAGLHSFAGFRRARSRNR